MGTDNLSLIIFFSILILLRNTCRKKKLPYKYSWRISRYHTRAATACRSRQNKHVNTRIMQLIAGKGSWSSPMPRKHCSCFYGYTCLGSPVRDLGDDRTYMPLSSGLPDFWHLKTLLKSTLHWFYTGVLLSFQGETLCSAARDLSVLLLVHYVTMMLPWKRIPNHHQQGIQRRKPLVLSQTVFRRMTSEFPENTSLWTTSATCYAYFSEQLENVNWYIYIY